MKLKLTNLNLSLQSRTAMNEETIQEYLADMKDGVVFDPIKVVNTREAKYLVDGYHRVEAMKRLGLNEVEALVIPGTKALALREAIGANAKHGLKRTNEDKLNALKLAWENRETLFGVDEPTERELAQIAQVSKTFVHNFLKDLVLVTKTKSENTPSQEPTAEENEAKVTPEKKAANLKRKVDIYGTPIPDRLIEVFAAEMPKYVMKNLKAAGKVLKKANKEQNPTFPAADQFAIAAYDKLMMRLKDHSVHCVCRVCLGEGCASCRKLGYLTPCLYDMLPSEYKFDPKKKMNIRACVRAN